MFGWFRRKDEKIQDLYTENNVLRAELAERNREMGDGREYQRNLEEQYKFASDRVGELELASQNKDRLLSEARTRITNLERKIDGDVAIQKQTDDLLAAARKNIESIQGIAEDHAFARSALMEYAIKLFGWWWGDHHARIALGKQQEELVQRNGHITRENEGLAHVKGELQKERDRLQSELGKTQKERDEVRSLRDQDRRGYNTAIDIHNQNIQKANAEIAGLKEELTEARGLESGWRQTAGELEFRVKELESEIATLRNNPYRRLRDPNTGRFLPRETLIGGSGDPDVGEST